MNLPGTLSRATPRRDRRGNTSAAKYGSFGPPVTLVDPDRLLAKRDTNLTHQDSSDRLMEYGRWLCAHRTRPRRGLYRALGTMAVFCGTWTCYGPVRATLDFCANGHHLPIG